jgi:hypothetical protein
VVGGDSERLVIIKTLLVISDSHCNSTVGLSKPTVGLDDGSQVSASTARRWLFHTFEDILEQTQKKYNGELYGLLNGDIIETDDKGRDSTGLITQNKTEAVEMATEVLTPFFQMCKGVFVTRGTEAHTGKQAQYEEAVAANFDNTIRDEETGRATRWHLPLDLDGVRMDICHHPRGAGNGRPMNSQSGIDRIASDTLFGYANDGEVPPHLVLRSHLHGYKDSHDAFRTRAIITPAMSLLTPFTHRIGINHSNPVGAVLIFCDDGYYYIDPLLYNVRKAQWTIL